MPHYAGRLMKPSRYKLLWGGRGGTKSWTFSDMAIMKAMEKRRRILCTRELQSSIADSVHQLLQTQITRLGVAQWFEVTEREIRCRNGSDFIFKGMRHNPVEIKSLEDVDIAWIEEAEKTREKSWEILIPTIRKEGSEIWVSMNPDLATDPSYKRFLLQTPPDMIKIYTSYFDNPFLPKPLRDEMEYLKRVDYEAYQHIWLGHCRSHSDAQVLGKKYVVDIFLPLPGDPTLLQDPAKTYIDGVEAHGPYFGLDFGFAADPSALVKKWVAGNNLYIEYEMYRVKLETNEMPAEIKKIPGADKHLITADSARPETISYLNKQGNLNVVGCDKWSGSVEDGIAFLRSFEKIVIHERCKNAIMEARLYSYKTDKLTGDVLPDIVDKHNHIWDAVRYGIGKLIKRSGAGMGLFQVMAARAAEKAKEQNK